MASLAEGDPTHLPAKNFAGDIEFHLTTAQLRKIEKAHASGKGCLLKLSPAQVKMMAQKGSGRFTDMLRQGYNMAKPALRSGLKAGVAFGARKLEDKIADAAQLEGEGFFGDVLKKVAHGGVDLVASQLGAGAKKGGWIGSDIFGGKVKPAKRKQQGKGFFGNVLKKVAHGGVDLIANQLGGKVKPPPKRKQQGKGFFGDIGKKLAHGGVDLIANQLGAGVPNPRANPNEGLRAALYQKKVGAGLYLP